MDILEALSSVFPKEDISLLLSMTRKQRAHELRHVMNIAIGIRVFQSSDNLEENDCMLYMKLLFHHKIYILIIHA